MFIEELWKRNPELVKKAVKKVCRIDEKSGNNFDFRCVDENGNLEFVKFGSSPFTVKISDYDVEVAFNHGYSSLPTFSIRWMKFMKEIYGDKYIYNYIDHRNKELEKYNKNFKQKTNKILEELGFETYKYQTK